MAKRAKKVMPKTYSMKAFIEQMTDETIRCDADTQRYSEQWSAAEKNELIVTILTDDHVPEIILGEEKLEEGVAQLWLIDGLQRGSVCSEFRSDGYKITSQIEDSIIEYPAKCKDEKGRIQRDDDGNVIWELRTFDIKGKRFSELPKELQTTFDGFQLNTVIHQDCTKEEISKLIRRYNNHKPMNATQKAFTFIDRFARKIKNITSQHRFFQDCIDHKDKEMAKGAYERVVCEAVMAINHLDAWKKNGKAMSQYLNQNATDEEFENFSAMMTRLEDAVGENFKEVFAMKNLFVWLAAFDRFEEFGLPGEAFAKFLDAFEGGLNTKVVDDTSWQEIDKSRDTKNKNIIKAKLDLLYALMKDYFEEKYGDGPKLNLNAWVRNIVNMELTDEDVSFAEEMLDDLTLNVDNNSILMEKENRPSLIAIVAFATAKDIDLDTWIVEYFKKTHLYLPDQARNYQLMKEDLNAFLKGKSPDETKKNMVDENNAA